MAEYQGFGTGRTIEEARANARADLNSNRIIGETTGDAAKLTVGAAGLGLMIISGPIGYAIMLLRIMAFKPRAGLILTVISAIVLAVAFGIWWPDRSVRGLDEFLARAAFIFITSIVMGGLTPALPRIALAIDGSHSTSIAQGRSAENHVEQQGADIPWMALGRILIVGLMLVVLMIVIG